MKPIGIYSNYRFTQRPWGGANNFLRLLFRKISEREDFKVHDDIESDYDILFLNQLQNGPESNEGYRRPLWQIKNLRTTGRRNTFFRSLIPRQNYKKIIVVRLVNLYSHAYGKSIKTLLPDYNTIRLANMADFVIYQSHYQRAFFEKAGCRNHNHKIIYNGADPSLFVSTSIRNLNKYDKIKIVSITATNRLTKHHDIIARFSLCNNVEVNHIGKWPKNIQTRNVKLLGDLDHVEFQKYLQQAHFYLHTAEKDICPNTVCEAILGGLPVIYFDTIGCNRELVRENGIHLDIDNLDKTVAESRKRYNELYHNIIINRDQYSINRTLDEYTSVFKCLFNSRKLQ